MDCNFHAAMRKAILLRAATVALLLAASAGASAERADRGKPLNVEADSPSKIDIQKQIVTFNGNVVITKGTMTIRAERIEVRETPDGHHVATATGVPGKPATFRQKRDGADEYIEGRADRLEYDGRGDVVRFVGNAQVRRLRGGSLADEVSGALITYDNTAEVFTVAGGVASPTNPGGRVRAVLVPRDGGASEPVPAAPPLKPVDKLSEPRG